MNRELKKLARSAAPSAPRCRRTWLNDSTWRPATSKVLAIETERGILLTPYDPESEEALAIAARVSGRYRNALRELAK